MSLKPEHASATQQHTPLPLLRLASQSQLAAKEKQLIQHYNMCAMGKPIVGEAVVGAMVVGVFVGIQVGCTVGWPVG